MAHLRCDFFSDVLGLCTSMTVLLPQRASTQIGLTSRAGDGDPAVLYLLHGLSDDDTAWVRNTSIERYVAPLGLAVIMPQVHRSFYTDEALGNRYWTFLSEELPAIVEAFFRVSTQREDTFVAGLSMGGYGAMRWSLRHPDRFGAAASLSGALDLAARQFNEDWRRTRPGLVELLFGDRDITGSDDDLLALVARADPSAMPPLYVCCGTGDELMPENERFVAECRDRGIATTVDFGPGEHDWAYWDAGIRDIVNWLPVRPI
jgi:S-formylglutathione hydrolase FrmB